MLRTSIPAGKLFGVDVRLHISFPLLLVLTIGFAVSTGESPARGVGLWLALCFAVVVREAARAIAVAHAGLRLRALFLLPVGGLMALSVPTADAARDQPSAPSPDSGAVALAGPLANFGVGLLLFGLCYALDPRVDLLHQPWIGTGHILRSFVWMQAVLGAVGLLPAPTRSAQRAPTPAPEAPPAGRRQAIAASLPAFGLGTALALAMVVAGFVLANVWLIALGGFMLLGAQFGGGQPMASGAGADSILVRDIMLTEYTLLSSSDTLQGALARTVHSLQDVFPVVRGDRLVGSVARATIAERLVSDGDSYLQGVMSRSLEIAAPEEQLVGALQRAAARGASEFIPVVEDDALIGILTPQSLSRAVGQVKLNRAVPNPSGRG